MVVVYLQVNIWMRLELVCVRVKSVTVDSGAEIKSEFSFR